MYFFYRFLCPLKITSATLLPLFAVGALALSALPLRANSRLLLDAFTISATPAIDPEPGLPITQPIKTTPPAPKVLPKKAPPPDAGTEDTSGATDLTPPTASPDEMVTVPKSSAIVVSFPAEITLDPKRKQDFPISLTLVQPIVDSEGLIVAPAKSWATANMKAMRGGDLIEIVSVVVGGRVIPLNVIGTLVPAQNKPEDVANPVVGSPGRLNNTLTALQQSSALTNHFDFSGRNQLTTFDMIDLGLSLGVGLTQPTPKIPPAFVTIAQNTVYILTLASPIKIPKRLVETGIQIIEKSPDTTTQ